MKGVKLEDVTGEKAPKPQAIHKPAAAGETGMIGRPKTLEEQMDSAAGQAAWGIVASFAVSVLLGVNAVIGLVAGAGVWAIAAFVYALVLAASAAWFMTKRSRLAACVSAGLVFLAAFGSFTGMFVIGFSGFIKFLLAGASLAAVSNAVVAVFTYHRLAAEVDQKKMSSDHIKDVFGDGDKVAEESA